MPTGPEPLPYGVVTSPSSPPPVAFRLKRPYASGDEFVAGDGHGISRGGMVLIGAGPRPPGLIVRFEIALRDGTALFRGEGKVVTHRPAADGAHPAGLEIRFTRLDASGKSLVDRVLRERASAATPPPAPAIPDLTPGAPRSVEATRPLPAVVGVPAARPSPVEIELTPAPAPNLPPVVAAPPPAPASVDIVIDADDGPPTEPPNPEATVMAPPVALAELSPEPTTAAPAAVPHGPGDPPEPESTDEPTTLVRMAVVSVAPPPPAPPSSEPSPASAPPSPAPPPAPAEAPVHAVVATTRAPAPAPAAPSDRAGLLGRLRGRGGSVARPPERDTLLVRLRERVRTPA